MLSDQLEDFTAGLVGQVFGATGVARASAYLDEDSVGEVGTFFELVLDDPEGETWPVEDLFDLRRQIREAALDAGLSGPFYFDLTADGPEDIAEDEVQQTDAQ